MQPCITQAQSARPPNKYLFVKNQHSVNYKPDFLLEFEPFEKEDEDPIILGK